MTSDRQERKIWGTPAYPVPVWRLGEKARSFVLWSVVAILIREVGADGSSGVRGLSTPMRAHFPLCR